MQRAAAQRAAAQRAEAQRAATRGGPCGVRARVCWGAKEARALALLWPTRTRSSLCVCVRPRQQPHLTSSVDDSAIERHSTFKQLASWGGFRRHFKEEEDGGHGSPRSEQRRLESRPPAEWKLRLHDQLLAKRAEIAATQQKLESLSLEQQALERLFSSAP